MKMNPEQEAHLQRLKDEFLQLIDSKYRKGQAEHGGDLFERDLLGEAILETVDLMVYLLTLREKLGRS